MKLRSRRNGVVTRIVLQSKSNGFRRTSRIPMSVRSIKKPSISVSVMSSRKSCSVSDVAATTVLPVAKKSAPPPIHLCLDFNGDEIGGEQPVDPNIPTPPKEMYEKWRTFVSAARYYPNVLVHPDVRCVRELFGVLGAEIPFEHSNLMIEFGTSERNVIVYDIEDSEVDNEKTEHCLEVLKPAPASNEEAGGNITFADIKEIEVVPHLDAAIVKDYSIVEECKTALTELVEMVLKFPESILYPDYNFLYEFFLQFGVMPEVITKEIYDTQIRRLQNKIPASSLLIKQGEPEVELLSDKKTSTENDTSVAELSNELQCRRESRVSSSYSGTDSGFSSIDVDQNKSSEDEFEDEDEGSQEKEESNEEERVLVFDDGVPQGRGKRRLRKPDTVMRTPFKCTVCPNRYAFKNNCNRHIMKCHPGARIHPVRRTMCCDPEFIPPFLCSLCRKGFSSKDACRTHIRKFHSKNKKARPELNSLANKTNTVETLPIKKTLSQAYNSQQNIIAKGEASHQVQQSSLNRFDSYDLVPKVEDRLSRNSIIIRDEQSMLAFMPRMEDLNNCYVLLEKDF